MIFKVISRPSAAESSLKRKVISRIEMFRRDKGDVISVSEIEELVLSLLTDENGKMSTADLVLYDGLQSLSEFITTMRAEIVALTPGEISREYIPAASDELDAIVEATETATNVILDATEAIESVQDAFPEESAEAVADAITKIYEACNFQDITGQRITKVVKTLSEIEVRIRKLTDAFGTVYTEGRAGGDGEKSSAVLSDQDLLNGPQLPDKAKKQDEVDELFSRDA